MTIELNNLKKKKRTEHKSQYYLSLHILYFFLCVFLFIKFEEKKGGKENNLKNEQNEIK